MFSSALYSHHFKGVIRELRLWCCLGESLLGSVLSCLVIVVSGTQSGSWKLHAFNVFMFVFFLFTS